MGIPPEFWQALTALTTAVAVYYAHKSRKMEKDADVTFDPSGALRRYIDDRAEHKARNVVNSVVNPINNRLDRLEGEIQSMRSWLGDDLTETQKDIKELFKVTSQLTPAVNSLERSLEQIREDTSTLLRMVGRIEG